ncbi:MAG: efflux RND transporter periplasmic adaptor subunit [Hydrogenophaga sp.]|uniref:HlyD family secretion protein n=1 Tax=Hydrogenophaga sp. TaxID=1904254 RepID=UPI001DC558D3|nr:efflux RND transporter periplasmic adaptor subunit [Hydrogenophaga sp.]MBX3608325.1 efflux RND transporter periplasmic adaptor subunit [Hydrogenophaga sp.]
MSSTEQATPNAPAGNPRRKKALLTIASVVVIGAVAAGAYEWFVASHYESTDNAYVQGNIVQITPQIGGTVQAILADETDFVKAGQPLVRLDPADAQLALEQAKAQLAQTVRQVRKLYADNGTFNAQIAARQADVTKARNEVARTSDDLARRQSLSGGAVSKEELQHAEAQATAARSVLSAADAALAAAREQAASNRAMTEGTSVEDHPLVLTAAAKVREAWLATQRLTLPAPVDGHVAKRTVQLGQRVAAGTPLMAIVPLQQVWVDANFKEVQLRNIRLGQPAELTADAYGKKVRYTGQVVGMGVGTGASFALLPAQNATGNWIKVVQRVPVRIALDPGQLEAHPLRVGLSMEAIVDVSHQDGKSLADAPASVAASTDAFDTAGSDAEAVVDRIIEANLGRPVLAHVARKPN